MHAQYYSACTVASDACTIPYLILLQMACHSYMWLYVVIWGYMWFYGVIHGFMWLYSSWKTQGYTPTGQLAYLVPRNHLTSAHRGGYNGGSPQKFIYKISCFLFEGELSKFFQALYSLRYLRGRMDIKLG